MINGLDLFSGIGGLTIALKDWVRPIAYCENDRYCQGILLSRMQEKHINEGPIWDDVRTLTKRCFTNSSIEIIYGGFPCQDISVAGTGKGLAGKRSGLFFEIIRLVEEISPSFVFLENVPAIRTRGLDRVLRSFTDLRYDCRWTAISAAEVGAPHIRKRWFLLAHNNRKRLWNRSKRSSKRQTKTNNIITNDGSKKSLADSDKWPFNDIEIKSKGKKRSSKKIGRFSGFQGAENWLSQPNVDRVVDGLPYRVDRIKALGNSVVPLQAKTAFEKLIGL